MSAGAFDSRSGRLASVPAAGGLGCFDLASIISGKPHLPALDPACGAVSVSALCEFDLS